MDKIVLWVEVGVVIILALIMLRVKKIFHRKMLDHRVHGKRTLNPFSMEILEKGFTASVLFISLLFILQIFNIDIVPLLAFSGIGAAILGFASKDCVSNFFGGLMVYATRPFQIGDYIELPEKKIGGNIEEIGWYLTSIRDSNKRVLYIPNSIFSTEFLLNHSRMTHRYINEKIWIRSVDGDRASSIIEAIRKIFQNHSQIDPDQPIHIFLLSLSPYGIEVEIKAYTLTTEYEEFMKIKQEIFLEIYKVAFVT
jgi:MscS family membrane protein